MRDETAAGAGERRIDERARDERLRRMTLDLQARARKVFPGLSCGELTVFTEALAGYRLQEEERVRGHR